MQCGQGRAALGRAADVEQQGDDLQGFRRGFADQHSGGKYRAAGMQLHRLVGSQGDVNAPLQAVEAGVFFQDGFSQSLPD